MVLMGVHVLSYPMGMGMMLMYKVEILGDFSSGNHDDDDDDYLMVMTVLIAMIILMVHIDISRPVSDVSLFASTGDRVMRRVLLTS